MDTVTSKDGTLIAYDRQGDGPAVILVYGALCYRSFGSLPDLVTLLAPRFTVYNYDRRGRGESGDTPPYAVKREVEDIEALVDRAGGRACLYGHSSGAALALETAIELGGKVTKLALYDAPYDDDDDDAKRAWKDYTDQLTTLLAAQRRSDAVALFMTVTGMPVDQIEAMRQAPLWPVFEALAPTLAYDCATLGEDGSVPAQRIARVIVPTLVMNGGASFMYDTARAIATAMPQAQLRTLEGQRHDVDPKVLAPALVEFFTA